MSGDEPPTHEAATAADREEQVSSETKADWWGVREKVPEFPFLLAGSVGVLAFAGGFVLLFLIVLIGPGSFMSDASTIDQLRWLAATYYSAHNVGLVAAGPAVIVVTGSVNLLWSAQDPAMPLFVYFAIPVVVLAVAGASVTATQEGVESKAKTALLTAFSIAVGYALVAYLGTYLVTVVTDTGAFHPARTGAALFGFAYPLVCGWIGSIAGLAWNDNR